MPRKSDWHFAFSSFSVISVFAAGKQKQTQQNLMKKGSVYIASKDMRGVWAPRPPGALVVDVTSAQAKGSKYRRDFSPMHIDPARPYKAPDGLIYANFEHFWQGGKRYAGIAPRAVRDFFHAATQPHRRYPGSKGRTVLHAQWDITGKSGPMGYVRSRREVYVPYYSAHIAQSESVRELRDRVERGESVVVYDFDGPRTDKGGVSCELFTPELFACRIKDERFPFGHGYVVAAMIAGSDPCALAGETKGE
jgi:hypothetical protein